MKFCGKCGQKVDAIKCPYCNYTQDKTYIAIKIKHSKKRFFFVGSAAFVIIIFAFTMNWAYNDGHGPLYDRGDFILTYEYDFVQGALDTGGILDLEITTERNQRIDDIVRSNQFFENLETKFNNQLKLPYDVPIYVGECGFTNAMWSPPYQYLLICYELIDAHYVNFQKYYEYESDEELTNHVLAAVNWIVVHELGHGVLDIYNLPVLGPQEDTADAAANVLLLSEGKYGVDSILSASDFFKTLDFEKSDETIVYLAATTIHGLDVQRYTDMLCFIFGSDIDEHRWIVEEGHLSMDKAVYCQTIFEENFEGWANQLEPYLKNDL